MGDEMTLEYGLPRTEPHDACLPSEVDDDVAAVKQGSTLSRLRWIRRVLVLGDAASLIAAVAAVQLLSPERSPATVGLLLTLVLGISMWVLVFHSFGLYRWNGLSRPSVFEELRGIVGATATGGFVISVLSVWWDPPPVGAWLPGLLVIALAFELVTRWLVRRTVRRQKREGRLALRTLLVGTNEEARWLCRHLATPGGWFAPVGNVVPSKHAGRLEGLPVVGDLGRLDEAILRSGAECVFVASTAVSSDDVLQISRACRRNAIELRLSANVSDILSSRLSVRSADGVTAIVVRPVRATPAQFVKRSVDLTLGSLLLVLAMPLLVVIALAIRVTSRGPIIFRQARITEDERVFTIFKFRTMMQDVERALNGKVIDLTRPFFKLEDDPRLTRVGRFLRSLSLDELPQLWNVIRGDMSLVGPRPLPAEQVTANADFLRPRHEVRAGLTGLWQISGRSELDSAEALRMDRFYIENWSLSLDLYILLKTVTTVLTRRGAY